MHFKKIVQWFRLPPVIPTPGPREFRETAAYVEHRQKAADALAAALWHATDEPVVNLVSTLNVGKDRDGYSTLTLTVRRRTYERRGL